MPESQRVKAIRKHLGVNQSDFAIEIGTVQSKISAIEKGNQRLSIEMAETIIKKFDISGDWLLGKIGNPDKVEFSKIVSNNKTIVEEPPVDYNITQKYIKLLEENHELQQRLNKKQEAEIQELQQKVRA